MNRNQTVVVSINHMDRHRYGLLPKGTFQKPTIVVPTYESTVGLPETDVLAAERANYKDRYFVNPDAVDKANGKLLTDILGTIDDMDTREELRIEHRKVFVPYKHGTKLKFPFTKAADETQSDALWGYSALQR